jgi:hypothetical protein
MTERNRWFSPAEPEQQGSHCDADSQIHYDNLSKKEAEDFQEDGMRQGQGIVAENEPYDASNSDRFNVTITDVDGQGYDYPSKYEPGR